VRRTGNGQKVGIVAKGFNFNWVFLALRMLVSFAAPVNYLATNCQAEEVIVASGDLLEPKLLIELDLAASAKRNLVDLILKKGKFIKLGSYDEGCAFVQTQFVSYEGLHSEILKYELLRCVGKKVRNSIQFAFRTTK
jgi:hypothetical protein